MQLFMCSTHGEWSVEWTVVHKARQSLGTNNNNARIAYIIQIHTRFAWKGKRASFRWFIWNIFVKRNQRPKLRFFDSKMIALPWSNIEQIRKYLHPDFYGGDSIPHL